MGKRAVQLTLPKESVEDFLKRPQCAMTVREMNPDVRTQRKAEWRVARYKAKGFDPERCAHIATHEVDGVKLCAKHAGIKALQILMESDQ